MAWSASIGRAEKRVKLHAGPVATPSKISSLADASSELRLSEALFLRCQFVHDAKAKSIAAGGSGSIEMASLVEH